MVSCYLLFCTIAIAWLSLGLVFAVDAVLTSRTESKCLSVLGEAAAQAEMEYVRNGTAKFHQLVRNLRHDNHLAYCAVVGVDGTFLAHTDSEQVGSVAPTRIGEQMSWGEVDATRYSTGGSRKLLELRVPLAVQSKAIGQLWTGSPVPDFWSTALDAAEVAPPAILVPLGLVFVGAMFLRRLTQPVAGVVEQLRDIGSRPPTAAVNLVKLPAGSVVNVGWNRVVEKFARAQQEATQQSITERVAAAIQGRKQKDSLHILDHLAEGLAVTDAEGRISFANRASRRCLANRATATMRKGARSTNTWAGTSTTPECSKKSARPAPQGRRWPR